ncbi:hypothetical protein [Rhizobium sp. S163]|uniref:hypothetical protein n=1 Tax=Rhizobium sp. S163 TaxID=3055039 RepID=UPI0025A9A6AB|nr:hypothetical protein [Rhizobium sp. S163]MDM9649098.1 hypothetical protein [Rhizobium sp. S163]
MTFQLNRTFGSEELNVIEAVLLDWCGKRKVDPTSPDGVLAGAVLVSLFQAGSITVPALEKAAAKHKWLSEFNDSLNDAEQPNCIDHLSKSRP